MCIKTARGDPFFPHVTSPTHLPVSACLRGCPRCFVLLFEGLWADLSLFPQPPLSQHPVSLSWHRSAGYLGNQHRVNMCDWSGWELTLGWWADFRGDSLLSAVSFGGGIISGICQRHECALVGWASLPGKTFLGIWSYIRRPGAWISKAAEGWDGGRVL